MSAPLVPIAVAFCIGILGGLLAAPPAPVAWSMAGISAGGAWCWRRRSAYAQPALLSLWVCLGILRVLLWHAHPEMSLKGLLPDVPQRVVLHGTVRDDPTELLRSDATWPDGGDGRTQPRETQGCVLDLRHMRTNGAWRAVRGRVRAAIHSPRELLRYGDEVLVEGRWSLVPSPGNPGQYDWRRAMERKRIHGLLRVAPYDGMVVLRHGGGHPLLVAVFRLRQRFEQLIRTTVAPRDAAALLALLLGQRGALDEHLQEAFKTTGTVHLLVISGFHVGVMAFLLTLFLRVMGIPWRMRLAIVAMGLGVYCLLVRMRPIRAGGGGAV